MTPEERLQNIRQWAENYPNYLSRRTEYARGYRDGEYNAHDIVLELLNEQTE